MSDNHGRSGISDIPIHDQHFAVHVFRILDCLGKSRDMVKHRVKMYGEHMRLLRLGPEKNIIAGSKGEGLTSVYESDHDYMFVDPNVICSDNTQDFINTRHAIVFQTEIHDTPAGYTKLKLIQCNVDRPMIQDSLYQDENMNRYLSSDFFMTFINPSKDHDNKKIELERRGPSLPLSDVEGIIFVDSVYAFCCCCPDLLQSFIARPRLYNRPDRTLLNDISKLEGHVVPVGCKGSETSYQEWRICFTKAEISLINSFNETQTKLYILLKMVSKIVKTVSTCITSYVIKNVVLWLIELYPVGMFTEKLLTTRLIQALVFLKKCVEVNFLPSYMIPERNLLPQMFDPLQRHKLTAFLNKLIQEGGYVLMRCDKLRVAMLIMYREPDMAEHFRLLRDLVEKLYLFQRIMVIEKQITTDLSPQQVAQLLNTDETYIKIQIKLWDCVVPEWIELMMSGCSPDYFNKLFLERKMLFLS